MTKIKNSGFTLIELLVVLSMFAVVIVVVNQILFSTFKGASKTEALNKVKREGDRVMGVVERFIRNAHVIYSCESSTVVYQDQYGGTGSFSCTNIGSGSGSITFNSSSLTANDVDVTACTITCESVNGTMKTVLINVSFAAKATAASPRSEEQGTITLQSRILLRN